MNKPKTVDVVLDPNSSKGDFKGASDRGGLSCLLRANGDRAG